MHFLIASNGSYGDVHPFLGIARGLQARGHDVTMISNERYAPLAVELDNVDACSLHLAESRGGYRIRHNPKGLESRRPPGVRVKRIEI